MRMFRAQPTRTGKSHLQRALAVLCVLFAALPAAAVTVVEPVKLILAGDPEGTPPDTPADRVDPNTTGSPYTGVVSLQLSVAPQTFICTGTAITPWHILTAGHCVDTNDDGVIDPGLTATAHFHYGSNFSHSIGASEIALHPDYTGFNNPSVNDDVAVLTLSAPVPTGLRSTTSTGGRRSPGPR